MAEYRIYKLDDNGQRSGLPSVGDWRDDNEAQAHARLLFNGLAHEIWCGDRKVATIKAGG